jgi:acyl-CoA thioesterase-1
MPQIETSRGPTLVVLGDSIGTQQGIPKGCGWVDILSERISSYKDEPLRVINRSQGGTMAASVAKNLPALSESLEKVAPVAIVLELGGNDRMFGASAAATTQHLIDIVENMKLIKSNPILIVMQIFPSTDAESIVVEKTGAILVTPPIEMFEAGGAIHSLSRKYAQSDGIHPNQSAQPLIARGLLAALHDHPDFTCTLMSEEDVKGVNAAADGEYCGKSLCSLQ